jgi:hypothetical protein
MKKFLLVIAASLLVLVVVLELLTNWMLSSYNHFSKRYEWNWLTLYQKDIEKNLGSDTLVLGCSVANQIFPFRARSNYKTTTAIDLTVTSYLFTAAAIRHNPQIKTVIILTIPYGFCQQFENIYSYNLFVKPYYRFSNFRYFDPYLQRKVAQKPFALLNALTFFKILPISDLNYDNGQPIVYDSLSEFSIRSLRRLKNLTDSLKIKLVFIPSPVSESFMRYTSNLIPIREAIHRHGFGELFPGYFENVLVFPDTCFKDGTHFKKEFLDKNRDEIILRFST